MKKTVLFSMLALTACVSSCGYRHVRVAQDITPGNCFGEKLDWRYGAGDIKIQTTKLLGQLMDRWCLSANYDLKFGRPRIMISDIDNRTDQYISLDMIRDIFESVAIDDGRFIVTVGDRWDEQELDSKMEQIATHPKYNNNSSLQPGLAVAPRFLAKVRITKAVNADQWYNYEDYRMTITLYDIETQVAIDSAWDLLSKRVCR